MIEFGWLNGRFLSPDRYTQDWTNTQTFNRYSYVNNNPLTLIDPTGFDDCDAVTDLECIEPIVVQCTENCGPDVPVPPPPDIQPSQPIDPGPTSYIAGVVEGINTLAISMKLLHPDSAAYPKLFCVAPSEPIKNLVDATTRYLSSNPGSVRYGAASEVLLALQAAFPCQGS